MKTYQLSDDRTVGLTVKKQHVSNLHQAGRILQCVFCIRKGSLSAMTVVVLVVIVTVFEKMPNALLIRNGKLRNSIHIRDIIPDRSTVLNILLDGATFQVRSTFSTC